MDFDEIKYERSVSGGKTHSSSVSWKQITTSRATQGIVRPE